MNPMIHLRPEQALYGALEYAGIEHEQCRCLSSEYDEGLYHFIVRSAYMEYEFYVDAANGEVLGINTEPLSHFELFAVCDDTAAA